MALSVEHAWLFSAPEPGSATSQLMKEHREADVGLPSGMLFYDRPGVQLGKALLLPLGQVRIPWKLVSC